MKRITVAASPLAFIVASPAFAQDDVDVLSNCAYDGLDAEGARWFPDQASPYMAMPSDESGILLTSSKLVSTVTPRPCKHRRYHPAQI
jgi:hypothetical protein